MGKIYYLMGKSASGKDTIYRELLKKCPRLRRVVLYTTRPMRDGECEGREYYFANPKTLETFEKQGKIIEMRTYQTVCGPWSYATVDDGRICLEDRSSFQKSPSPQSSESGHTGKHRFHLPRTNNCRHPLR